MAILNQWFFHDTIKLYTGIFGTLFDSLKIRRGNGFVKVPIAYNIKQKYDVRNTENPDPNVLRKKIILPRMGFRLIGLRRDPTRITNKLHRLKENVNREGLDSIAAQYNRVPHIFQFELSIKTKNIEDMSQILEQILPVFNPAVNVIVSDNKDLDSSTSINVKLSDNGLETMSEGSFEDEQIIETVMTFDLEGYLYMPTESAKIINVVNVNYFNLGMSDDPIDIQVIQ